MSKFACLLPILAILASCGAPPKTKEFSPVVEEFVFSSLAFSPVAATSVGYHEHNGVHLDSRLDDFSPESIDKQRSFYSGFRGRLSGLDISQLSQEDRADYDIVRGQVDLALLELDTIQNFKHNPTLYVELIGNALFTPYTLEYAPLPERYKHIIGRLQGIPALLDQAKKQLTDAPDIWTRVAQDENAGNIGLIEGELQKGAPEPLRAEYGAAAKPALEALRGFSTWLETDLAKRTSDWRLGKEKYGQKFRYVLATAQTPEEVLASAEADLRAVRKQMFELSLPLHHKMYPSHKDPVDLNLIVGETLRKIAERHSTPANYFADARRDLQETREFVKQKNLLPLPSRDNLKVIETPEFMRGIYAVGGFNPAPALQPELGAFYWLTPIPKDWPKDRVESKLREYNHYGLKLLTIHEAMPGHYVQFEYANDIQPRSRRLVRGIFGSGPYIEGWAVYATEMMLDEGYLDKSPELRLTFLKQQLRMIANTILDVRLQTMGMTDDQAMKLMLQDTFQEKEEATAKLRRAKLSSTQLPTYYVGYKDWMALRASYSKANGNAFRLPEFHERALKAGAVPLPVLGRLLAN